MGGGSEVKTGANGALSVHLLLVLVLPVLVLSASGFPEHQINEDLLE